MVINYDVPVEKDSYVHRIGRTGRAGNGGHAITLVTGDDIMSLYEIEEHIGALIVEGELPTEADFNERRATAEKWIRANSVKNKSPKPSSVPNQKKAPHKPRPAPTQQLQHNRKHRDRPFEGRTITNHKAPIRNRTEHPRQQPKPIHTAAKPIQPRSVKTIITPAKRENENTHTQAGTTKKPFFKRVLQRILGK